MSYYGTIYNDEYLAHHGVKGMKWGVRKDKSSYLSRTRLGKKIDTIKKSAYNVGDERYVNVGRAHRIALNKAAYKSTVKGKAKRLAKTAAIMGGATLGAAALGAGLRLATRKKKDTKVQNDPILTNRTMSGISPEAAENYIRYRKMKDQFHQYKAGAGDFHNFKR